MGRELGCEVACETPMQIGMLVIAGGLLVIVTFSLDLARVLLSIRLLQALGERPSWRGIVLAADRARELTKPSVRESKRPFADRLAKKIVLLGKCATLGYWLCGLALLSFCLLAWNRH